MALKAAYSFDAGNATDDSASGHNGTLQNSPTFPSGHTNSGLGLVSASFQYVEVADHADFTLSTWTIMAWIKLTTNQVCSFVPKPNQWWFGTDGTQITHGVYKSGGGTVSVGSGSVQLPATQTWFHVACRYDGTYLDILYNGSVAPDSHANVGSITMADTGDAVRIGSWNGSSEWLDGVMDDVRIFDNALTDGEVSTYMNTPVTSGGGGGGSPSSSRNVLLLGVG